MQKNKTYELQKRLLFTIWILSIYMVGRSLLLYGVDASAYSFTDINSQNLLYSMVSGDRYQYTFFALGIMPAISSMLIMQFVMALIGSENKARFSPKKIEKITVLLLLILSGLLAFFRAEELVFKDVGLDIGILKAIATIEMVIGALVVFKMANINREHGIGGQSIIILVNLIDTFAATVRSYPLDELMIPFQLCCIMMLIMYLTEKAIIKIPVQRVSIHNSYAERDYIAFKLNPIGVMPVMFATTFFMLPQLLLRLLIYIFGANTTLVSLSEKMNLMNPIGVLVYLGIIIILSVLFSFILLTPGEMAEQLQKGGDSIVDVYAGTKTKKYLRCKLLLLSIVSGIILSSMMGFSFYLSLTRRISASLALLPSSAMLLMGLVCRLYEEFKTYKRFDSYRFFI